MGRPPSALARVGRSQKVPIRRIRGVARPKNPSLRKRDRRHLESEQAREKNRKLSPRDLVLQYVNDQGSPLFSDWDASDKTELSRQLAFDATCRKFFKFMTRKST
jgi:hypothetical protein